MHVSTQRRRLFLEGSLVVSNKETILMSQEVKNVENPLVTSETADNLEVTTYQGGNAVVREKRPVELAEGKNRVQVGNLPATYVENSFTVDTVEGEGSFKLGPMTYRPADLSSASILAGAVGQTVTLFKATPKGVKKVRGVLRHILGNQLVLEVEGKTRVVQMQPEFEIDGEKPKGLSATASLLMVPTVSKAGKFNVNVLYEAGGINWSSRYEAIYDSATESLKRLICWVDLVNGSGTRFANAKFKLLASANYGAQPVRRAMAKAGGARMAAMSLEAAAAPMADFGADGGSVENVGEQKLYVLPEALTVENNDTTNAILVLAGDIPVTPEYYLNAGYYEQIAKELLTKLPVNIRLRAKNDKDSKLGMALPPGAVTVLERDSSGALQKTDGCHLGHIAEDEKFAFELRNCVRDLKATRRLVEFKEDPEVAVEDDADGTDLPITTQGGPGVGTPGEHSRRRREAAEGGKKKKVKEIPPRYREEERELVLHNYKDKEVSVLVSESVPHNAEFLKKSHDFAEFAQGNGSWKVAVPAKGSTTVTYRIKYRIN